MPTIIPNVRHSIASSFPDFKPDFMSKLEISCLNNNPEMFEEYMREEAKRGNGLLKFLSMASEDTIRAQPIWTEAGRRYVNWAIPGLIKRAGDVFTIDDTAYESYLDSFTIDNVDSCLSDGERTFDFAAGTLILVVDEEGNKDVVEVISVATNKKSFTAKVKKSATGTWTTDANDLEILVIGETVDIRQCDYGNCNRMIYNDPSFTNGFVALDKCFPVNLDELLEKGSIYSPDKTNPEYRVNISYEDMYQEHMAQIHKTLVFGHATKTGSDLATAGGGLSDNFKGLEEQIAERGMNIEGSITKDILEMIADRSDSFGKCDNFNFWVTPQERRVMDGIASDGVEFRYDPFISLMKKGENPAEVMRTFGFNGIRIGNHNFYYTNWELLTVGELATEKMQNAYKGFFLPYGNTKVKFKKHDGTWETKDQNHINVLWKGAQNIKGPLGNLDLVYKMRRKGGPARTGDTCYNLNVTSEFTLIAAMLECSGMIHSKF